MGRRMPAIERFRAKVDSSAGPDGCHVWTGAKTKGGYGTFLGDNDAVVYTHRWILGVDRGEPLASHEWALHKCDNPPCVNPRHLYVGDIRQNVRDAMERGRANLDGLALGRLAGKTLGQRRTGSELCGSNRGLSRHYRHGEKPCEPCRVANRKYQRTRRAAAK